MIDPSKVDLLTDPRHSMDPKVVADGEERLQDTLRGLGVCDKTTTARWSHPAHPQGDILWYLRSGTDVYQVEALPVPVVKGAGERTHRLWLNGNPMIGHQWCYSLEDAQWWAHWAAERDLKIQLSLLKDRVLDLESKLSRQRFTPQPY